MSTRMDRLERLFRAAQLHSVEERPAFIDAACADDPELRRELEELLGADERAEAQAFLEGAPPGLADGGGPFAGNPHRFSGDLDAVEGDSPRPSREDRSLARDPHGVSGAAGGEPHRIRGAVGGDPHRFPDDEMQSAHEVARAERSMWGRRIGPYVIQRRLGYGGMGDVYLGVREEPFRQYIALKIIRRGMDSGEVVARFEVERQILAALNHPAIARLLDGGVTDDGLPYFAMEYVNGRPITTYCDERRLTLRERLRLFQEACRAVHFAHQNLVIHRDLKPSNILVADDGAVKLLDFGIAKLVNPHLSPIAVPVTRHELRLMTPEYASPEQLRGEPLTTAADVYALGVILYELLTGRRPHRVAGRPTNEIISVVCEQEPERPSTRVLRIEAGADEAPPEQVSERRRTTPDRLQRQIRGDLDNITLMALRKEPERRYSSAEQFRRDVDRYLSGMPVEARPNTAAYRIRKFASRHRTAVAAAVLALCSLLGGLTAALWQAREAHRERDRAEAALARSETVTSFLAELFKANDPRENSGVEVTARELLQRGVERAEALQGSPGLQAHLLEVIGSVYQGLGQYEHAARIVERALRLQEDNPDRDDLLVARTMTVLASVLTRQGRYDEAEALLRRAMRLQDGVLDGPHLDRINTLQALGYLLPFTGKWREAEKAYDEVVEMRRALLGNEHPLVANSMVRLATNLRAQGRYDESESLLREALAMHRRTAGEETREATENMFQLAILLTHKGEYEEVEALLRRAIDVRTNLFGEDDPEISSYLFELGEVQQATGRAAEADATLRRALAHRRRVLGEHPSTGDGLLFLASFLHEQGAMAEADSLYEEALAMRRRLFGREHLEIAVLLRYMGVFRIDQGRYEEAESLLTRAHAMHLRLNGPEHHHVGRALAELGRVQELRGNTERAADLYIEALEIFRKNHQDEHVEVQEVLRRLSDLYDRLGLQDQSTTYRSLLRPASAGRRAGIFIFSPQFAAW